MVVTYCRLRRAGPLRPRDKFVNPDPLKIGRFYITIFVQVLQDIQSVIEEACLIARGVLAGNPPLVPVVFKLVGMSVGQCDLDQAVLEVVLVGGDRSVISLADQVSVLVVSEPDVVVVFFRDLDGDLVLGRLSPQICGDGGENVFAQEDRDMMGGEGVEGDFGGDFIDGDGGQPGRISVFVEVGDGSGDGDGG